MLTEQANETKTPTKEELLCDRCGESCADGYEVRHHGPVDRQTGCQDSEIVCSKCLELCTWCGEPECVCDNDRYEAGDRAWTEEFEEMEAF